MSDTRQAYGNVLLVLLLVWIALLLVVLVVMVRGSGEGGR